MLQNALRRLTTINPCILRISSNLETLSFTEREAKRNELVTTKPTYNIAPIVNHNEALKQLFHLGVDISRWEKEGHLDLALSLTDFKAQVQPTIEFIIQQIGLSLPVISQTLTQAPQLLKTDVQVLETRLEYMKSKKFTPHQIRKLITKRGDWLTLGVNDIDNRLGYFQKTFSLKGFHVRELATKDPSLILWIGVPSQTRENIFAVKELMGFNKSEIKRILLENPELFRQPHEEKMVQMFDFLHNRIGYSHFLLTQLSPALLGSIKVAKERYAFLEYIGRGQYNSAKPNYVSPIALTLGEDKDFCELTAKTSEGTYNQFLKTL
ncbi:transcription termination factor 3, mitochondrial [Lepeophtheirus salmonis]|uniref:transcription termination factor 3, mitochondrial n=1 Tax=Lepeophtheirus salmonis TaxID=72036 RepID=UPI001AE1DE52|nr:transcription termination factor 3, mitochondrial-like [Lepeophtheirus salmonis]